MTGQIPNTKADRRGILSSLARDVRGNTLAMMAMFLIPLTGLVGSAVDISRLYVVKARLQQACDAGSLAGRKFMVDPGPNLDANATAQAQAFFANNFKKDVPATSTPGFMNTSAVSFTPTRTVDSQVAGTATATVPMTITKMFGTPTVALNVTCQARYDVADTDVMFILDNTGSMACLPGGPDTCGTGTSTYSRPSGGGGVPGYAGSTGVATNELMAGGVNVSRIEALRQAVLSFYDTFAANADPSTHVRYGFVTYTSVVNAGQAILDKSSSYLVGSGGAGDTASYQSRRVYADLVSSTTITNAANGKTQSACNTSVRTPATALTYTSPAGTATRVYDAWSSSLSKCQTKTDSLYPQWQYMQLPFDVSSLIQGNTITDPTKVRGQTTSWMGCVETKVDTPGQSTFTTTSLPSELDPDIMPSGTSRWWPHLQDLEYARNGMAFSNSGTGYSNNDDTQGDPNYGADSNPSSVAIGYPAGYLRGLGYVTCGKPVKRLGVMSRSDVYNYVYASDFVPMGGTYHDTGMIWGTRLISPSGAWASDTAAWPNRNAPNRVIIFLTDGDMAPNTGIYGMYGVEAFDKRVAGSTGANLTDLHNARFLAECSAAKARNIDVWTVSIDTSANAQLTACATTTTQALATTTGGGLSTAFASIAKRLAMLRLTK